MLAFSFRIASHRKWCWIFILVPSSHIIDCSRWFSSFLFTSLQTVTFSLFFSFMLVRSLTLRKSFTLDFGFSFHFCFFLSLCGCHFMHFIHLEGRYPLRLRTPEICVHLSRRLSRRSFYTTIVQTRIHSAHPHKTLLISKFKCTTYLDHHSVPIENPSWIICGH